VTGDRTDRALNGVLAVVAVLTAGSVIMLMVALPAIFSSSNNSDQVRRGNELTTCRADFVSNVDEADGQLSAAKARLLIADSDQLSLLPEGLAAALQDPDSVGPILAESIAGQEAIEAAQADVLEKVDELFAAVEARREANRRSRVEPEEFLAECKERD